MVSNYKIYENHRVEPYFSMVKNGQKTIEGRIRKGWYKIVRPGDHVIVKNQTESDSVEVLVKRVQNYDSFRELLEKESINKILPNVKTVEEGENVYRQFYTKEQEKSFGVVAIEVQKLNEENDYIK